MAMCRGKNKILCAAAYALRVSNGSDCLDIYLLGDIKPEEIATFIVHNNEAHGGWTYEQIGHLLRIMETRSYLYGHSYDWKYIIRTTEKKVDEYSFKKRNNDETSEDNKLDGLSRSMFDPFYFNMDRYVKQVNSELPTLVLPDPPTDPQSNENLIFFHQKDDEVEKETSPQAKSSDRVPACQSQNCRNM